MAVSQHDAQVRRQHEQTQHRQAALYSTGRVLLAAVFLVSAIAKVADYRGTLLALRGVLADAELLLPIAIGLELVGGTLLLVGLKARAATVGLIAYLFTVTALMHHDLAVAVNRAFALTNLALVGALLMVVAHGAGAYSLDKLMGRSGTQR
jgi:putative oxidoreductase